MKRLPIQITASASVRDKLLACAIPLGAPSSACSFYSSQRRRFGNNYFTNHINSRRRFYHTNTTNTTTTSSGAPTHVVFLQGCVSPTGEIAVRSTAAQTKGCFAMTMTAAGTKRNSSLSSCSSSFSSASTTMWAAKRHFSTSAVRLAGDSKDPSATANKTNNALQGVYNIREWKEDEQQQHQEEPQQDQGNFEAGYLPFPPPFHTFNIVMFLFLANVFFYGVMNFCANDDVRDFIIEHFTLSHENWHRIYPFFTSSFYQEQLLQLAIDCWLLWQFGNTVLGFLGNGRMTAFWAMTCLGGGLLHVGRQYFELYYGIDPLEVRGRCYGPNPFILGLVAVEGLIFRHLNFMQNPPVPFLVMTAFVMIIDVWRIFTIKPEEHGAPTGGALVAYVFWVLPTKMFGLSKLTAAL